MTTPNRRLIDVLGGRPVDRAAVVCPGGMMSLAVTEVMKAEGVAWPEAHGDPDAMLRLAFAMQQATGFDNLALPFCMTVEAEAYGAAIDMGDMTSQPRVAEPSLPPDGSAELPRPDFRTGRAGVLLEALETAKQRHPELPLVGNLVGPFSLLGMLCDPLRVLRWTRRQPDVLRRFMSRITDDLAEFGRLQADAGADVMCIAEPTATGEILGGKLFRTFVLDELTRLVGTLRAPGRPVIVHICGNIQAVRDELFELPANALSFDSMVDLLELAQKNPPWEVMGNVDAFLLEAGPIGVVEATCELLLDGGVRLLAPACGVVPNTPVSHLRAMRDAADRET